MTGAAISGPVNTGDGAQAVADHDPVNCAIIVTN